MRYTILSDAINDQRQLSEPSTRLSLSTQDQLRTALCNVGQAYIQSWKVEFRMFSCSQEVLCHTGFLNKSIPDSKTLELPPPCQLAVCIDLEYQESCTDPAHTTRLSHELLLIKHFFFKIATNNVSHRPSRSSWRSLDRAYSRTVRFP